MNLYKDKHIYLPLFALLAVVVGYRAWQDMHPPPEQPKAIFETFYYVRDDKGMAPFTVDPDDQRPLVVFAGDIHADKDGALKLDPSPVTPIGLPQREIILSFTLDKVPSELGDLAPLLTKAAQKWQYQGDLINDIYLKAPLDEKSLAELLAGINGLREDLHSDFWLGLFVGRQALNALPEGQKKLEEASKSLRTAVMNLKEAQKPGEQLEDTILKIDHDHEIPFLLEVDELPDFKVLQRTLKPEPERFVGFLLDAEKAAPPQK